MTDLLSLIGAALAGVLGGWIIGRRLPMLRRSEPQPRPPTTFVENGPPELAWVARANGALGIWLRRSERAGIQSATQEGLSRDVHAMMEARLPGLRTPTGSGSTGTERLEQGTIAFVAADDLQVAMLLPPTRTPTTAAADLEHLVATFRTQAVFEAATTRPASAGETPHSVAVRLALEVERNLDAEVAVAVRRPQGVQVLGTALRADPHLHRHVAAPGSPVDLYLRGERSQPALVYEPFGVLPWDRRHRERRAYMVPLRGRDGDSVVGVLVIWTPRGEEPAGPHRAELERSLQRSGTLLDDALRQQEVVEQAVRDPLTGLPNRRGLEHAMGSVGIDHGAVICLDLDHFKSLNDSLGHPAGDAALKFVARVIGETVREGDTPGRVGGEEFAIWLPSTTLEEAARVAERIRTRIAGRAWGWEGTPWPITASFGVAGWPESTLARENIIALADQALYQAKQGGRNRVMVSRGDLVVEK